MAVDDFLRGCTLSIADDSLQIYAPDEMVALALRRSAKDLARWAVNFHKRWTLIFFPGCNDRPYQIPAAMASSIGSSGDNLSEQLENISEQDALEDLKILERVVRTNFPRGLCALESDNMIWANPALVKLVGVSPEEARSRNVRSLWQASDRSRLALEEIKKNLRQESNLPNFPYEAELNPGQLYSFCSSFEAVYLPGQREWARLVTIYEAAPIKVSV